MPRRFDPRPVGLEQASSLLTESLALFRQAPSRLTGLFLLVFFPIQLLPALPYFGMPLREALAAIGYAGIFVALEAVRVGRKASLPNMAVPWRLPPDKILLLVASGLVPLLGVLFVWWADWGGDALNAYLSGATPDVALPARQEVEFVVVSNLLGMPLLFVQPLAVLYSWSGSRTLAASLLVWAANWRWVGMLALGMIPVAIGLDSLEPQTVLDLVLTLAVAAAVELGVCVFTLTLLQRSLRMGADGNAPLPRAGEGQGEGRKK